jgi:BirA family biotin operon repressor/biotin-[acetyl-CoA-carboxylase] ligase
MDKLSNTGSFGRLDLPVLRSMLSTNRLGRAPAWDNELWDCIDSTNNRAAELFTQGAPEGVLILARQQTAGRGRQGRTWISPPDAGVYMSFLLRPSKDRTDLPLHTLACGVACVKAIWECAGLEVGLKWVNDLVVSGKKVGGILAEIPSSQDGRAAGPTASIPLVLGIGINMQLDLSELPEELKDRVDSLENLAGQPVDPNLLVSSISRHLEQTLDLLASGHPAEVLDAWRLHSVTLGKHVSAVSGTTEIEGLAVDIDQGGGLIIETATQGRVTLHAGEITIRNSDGTYA